MVMWDVFSCSPSHSMPTVKVELGAHAAIASCETETLSMSASESEAAALPRRTGGLNAKRVISSPIEDVGWRGSFFLEGEGVGAR
jgi:hypothetical protein